MNKSSLRQQQLQLQQQQQQQQMMADNDAAALAAEMFDAFCAATTMRQILGLYRNMCDTIGLRPGPINEFYPKLKQKIRSWKAQALWKKFDTRASHRVYNKGNACPGSRVLVIGAGPCGLRAAIEAQLLGAKVCVVEKRDRISRNNVVHLWPFVITDLRNLGAKKFYGKFCAGSIDHISIRQLQCILLKVALLLGVEIHEGVSFLNTLEPSDGCGWRAEVQPTDHAVSHYEFDVLFGADGKRNTLEGFKRKEFRGKLAIAITANFINKKTEAEARAEEISGVAFIFNQSFFKELYQTTGIDLENIVYYKDETHYFVMTAKKHSLIDKNVIIQDFADPAELLAPQNVNTDKLLDYAREAAEFSTKYQMPNLEFAVNHYGKPDVAMFDFTSMFAAEASSRVIVRKNYRLLQCLVGDSLLEPFWPTGSGCARGFLSSMDAAYMIKLYANQRNSILGTLAQRESIYRLLAQTTPENLQRDIGAYTVDPATRYPNLNKSIVNVWQVKHLIDTDDPNLLEQVHMDTNALQQANIETPIRRKRRTGDMMPLSTVLLRWIKAQLHAHEFAQNLTETSECITNGKILSALINRYRPDLIDLNTIKDLKPIECNELSFKILETDLNIPRCISAKQSMTLENVESNIWLNYLEQICEEFRGEIPHVKHPKLDYFELKEKSSRDKKPDFSHLLNRTTKLKAKSPMQDIDLTTGVHRRSILDEDKVRRQRKNVGSGNDPTVLVAGHGGDTSRRAKKRRSQEKTTNIEERQQRLKEIEANRLERQSKRKQQRYQQTQNFYKSLQMLQAENLLREDNNDQPFEDYSIYMYRQNAPEFNDRVKMLEQKLLHPDRERGIQSAFPRNTDEQFSNRIKSMEQQITSRTASGSDKKPKDLLRAIGKIDSSDWNIREIEKKIEQSKKTETPGKSKEKVPKWSKEQFLARQNKMSKPPVEREEESEEKFKEIDQTLKNLDKQLKEGSIREIGERGKNKVASIAGQFGKKDDTSDEKPATHTKSSSKVPSVFKNQAASEKCHFCKQTVYLMEKISTENLILHRSCLKCYHCHTNLRLGAYAFDRDDPVGRFYCTQHFRLPAKAIRPMARKSTKQQKKTIAVGHPPPSAGGNDTKATDQILRSRPETVAQLDLLDRGQTPERIEFENADAMSDGEPSLENIIDENEWTDRNFVSDSDDSESDLSSSDESDDESESFDDADDGSPIAQTLQLATDWIGKQRYSNGGSDDSDNDFYDSSDGLLDENDADSQTEGEEFKKAREMRRQEVKLLPIPTNLPTDTETEVKQKDDVQLNDNNNSSNQNNNSNNNNKDSNENLAINNSISICSSDNNMNNNIPSMLSKTEIKIIERDLGRAISTEIDTLNENLFNLNNFLKLNKDVENIRKENLVKNDIMKKLSLKEKWLNESNTGASNLSLHKIGDQSEIIDIKEEKPDDKQESEKIDKEIKESEKVKLGEMKVNDDKTESADRQNDGKMDIDTNAKYTAEENNSENTVAKELKTLECEKISTEIEKDNKDEIISNNVLNEVNEIVESIKSITIEKPSKDTKSENANDLSKSIENVNSEPSKAKEKCDDADIGQLLYDVENKCSPKVQRRQKSKALKKIEARSFADTKGVIESQITGPKMSKQSSLDLSRYFPNQKQEKTSTVAANKNQKTLKDVDLNQYFAQSPIAQRKISAPAALRKCSTEKIIPALYKPTIKEKLAEIEPTLSTVVESKPKPNILHYKPTMKEILATDVISADVKSTTSSAAVDSKPKPNILHYKPTMKEILAAPVDSSKIDIESRPIPPKRQKNKVKESGSSENLNKKKTKDSDFNIYDQQVDGSVDLKKKVSKSISKNNEKNPNTTKKKIIKKITKKSPSLSITDDSPKLRKKFDNENSRSAKSPLNYEDEILNEILNSDDYEIRSPSIEYHKLFHEEKSPSEDISDRIEKILIETGIDLGLPRRSSSVNRKKLLKAKSLGEDEFINNKNQLSVFEDNVKEDGDKPISFQNILKRFESMSSVKHSDDKTVENKLNDIHERRYSRDSMKSKKSSSDEFSDLERTLEYLKSEWKTEATNFLQKKRNNFFSKPKSTVELREQIEEDEKRLKRNTEEYFEAQIKYEKSIITKEKSPKRKIMDNGNNKAKEMKIDRTKQEKELVKRRNSKEEKFETNHSEMSKRKNSNENKISVKTISKVKSFEICDSELDDMEVDDIFNEIVNELHINDDKLGTQDIYDVLSNQQVFELQEENKILNLSKNISPVKASKLETDEYKLANKSNENNRELNGLRDDSKICTYKKEVDNDQIKLEKVQNNIAPKQTISPKKSLQNYKYVKPNEEISESNKLHNDSKIHVSHEECTPKNKIEIVENNTLPIKSHSPEDIKLKLVENIKSNEINILQQDVKTSISNKKIETSVTKLEMVNENCMPSKATLSKSNSPKFNNLESQKSAEKYALNNEINNSNSILRKNSLQKATPEISNSPILNSAKAVMEQEKLFFTVSTKSPSSVQKMSSLNCSKSSTDEDSIDQLFSQFTDDMLVDVEFDSNDELIAITPRAIVKKRDELTIENLECFAITSEPIICESAENKTKSNGENLEGIPITYEPIVRKLVEKEQSNVENLGRSEFKSESNIPKSAENKDESKVENLHIRKSVEKKENLECVAHTSEGIIRKSAEEKDESNSEKLEYVPTTSKPVIREFSEKKQSNDDNLECVAYTSEAIIRKSAEKKDELKVENLHIRKSVEKKDDSKVENLECVAHTSEAIIRKSAEKIYESNSEKLEYVPTASKPVIREFAEKNQSNDDNLECVAQTSEGIIRKSAEKKYESNSEKLEYVPTTSKPVIREFAEKNQSNDDNLECVPQTSEGIIRKSAEKKDESNSEKLEYVPTASKPVIREFAEKNQSNDDNLECVAQTSEGIIRKSAEKKYESNSEKLEYVPTTSKPVIRESAEKKQSNDDNLECVAHTSEAIIRKSVEKKDKLNVENLESNATELRSRKSVEEEQNDIQFPMKPPRRQKTVSSSASPDIPSIPIRAKHIAKQSKELPPSVQDIIETMRSNDNDDNNLYFIPINNAKPVRFPSRYEEEEDIAMEYSEPLNANESADCDNIVIADEITASQLVPVIENGRSEFLEYKIVDRVDNFLSSEDNLPVTTLTGDNSTILDKTTPSQIDSEQVEKKLKENICSIQDDHHSKNKSSRDNISIVNNTNEMRSHDKKLVTLPENSCSQDIFDVTKQTNVMTQSNTFVDGDNTSIKLNKTKLDKINVDNFQPIKENVLIQETKKTSPVMKDSNIKETVPEIADSELEDWEIIEKLEKERMRALRKRDQMYFNANNSPSLVDRPRLQTQVSSSDSFESALSKSIPELSVIPKTTTPPPVPPPRSPRPVSKFTHGDKTGQKSLPIEVIEHPLHTVDRAYSPSSTQSKNSSHSLSHSVESISNRPQRPKSNPSENIPVDYGTRMLLERSQMLRDRKKDFMDDKMVGNNPYMKKMITTERKHRADSDNDDEVEFPESYRPSNLNTRNTSYSRFPTSRAIQDRVHYNSAATSSGIDRYGTGTSNQYSRRLSPINTISYSSPINSSRHLTDYFKRSPSSSKEHHYHHHHPRDHQSKDSCVQSDSESSSADDDINSATEISTDSEFDHDPITRETPKILIDDTHLRKPTKVQIKQVIIGNNNGTHHPPKLQNVTNTKLTSTALQNALTHQELEFKPLVQVDPSLLNSNRIIPLKNPRPGDYLLNKTASTEGIASKTSLELKKRYLLGGDQQGFGNKIMKSGSTSILDTKLKSFHSNISECQKKLNAASEIGVGMKTFLDRTTKLSSNDKIVGDIEKKISETEMKLKKDLEEKENVFVNSKNELNKGMEYSETVNTALIEHITKNPKAIQSFKIPSPIIETIDLISPEKEVPNSILKQTEFNKQVQINETEKNDDSIEVIDLTYSPPNKVIEKSEKPDISKNSVQPIPDIIQQTEKIKSEPSQISNSPPSIALKKEELDNECQDTCIQVPQIPWPTKKNLKDDVESDSLSSSSSTSSLEDIPHYILDSTTSPDTQNCGTGGGIVPRLEIHDTSGALMQIDSLMIIDGKYIGDPEDLPLMDIPEGMTTSTPTSTEATTIVDIPQKINNEVICEKTAESKETVSETIHNKNLSKIPLVNSTKDLRFDSRNENKIESLKNLPLIYDKKNEDKKPKPQSLDLVKTVAQASASALNKFSPKTITPTTYTMDNDKTPTANDNNHQTDSETEQTGQLLTETELSDWTADDAVSENFVDIEFVLNSNKGTIKRNKKSKKGKLNSKCGNQFKNPLRLEKYSPTVETPRECGGILENLAIGEIDFMDTGSEGSCAETYAATNNALIKNRGYIEFIENTAHNEYSPTTTRNVVNLRQNPKTNFSDNLKSYKRSNSAKEILGIDYIEQGACILNSNVNNDIELKTPVNEISLPIFSIGQPISVSTTNSQQSPKLQHNQQLQSLTDSTNELDDDSLVMMTSQSATNTNTTTTTTEESDALTVVTSPLDSSSPRIQENLITSTISSSTTTSSTGTNNKTKDNKSLSNKTPSPLTRRKILNEEQQVSSRKRSSQEDLLNNTKGKDSDEMSYEEYVRKLQQKITQISNAKDSIDVRKHKRKTSRGNGESAVPTINELDRKEMDETETKDLSQINKFIGDNKSLSIFSNNMITNDTLIQKNVNIQEVHKVPEIPTLSSKLEEITKQRTKQKDLIHDLVMDKLQSKKQLNAEKRLNRSRNRNSVFSPRAGSNDNNLMISSTPKLMMSSSNDCTNNYKLTKSATEQIQTINENIPNKKKNTSPRENKDIVQMFNQANVINRKQRPLSDNLDKIAINYLNYEQPQTKPINDARLYSTPITSTRINCNLDETPLTTNTGKMKAEARARARLKSNQDLGLSPEEKLQLLRKRYHLDLQEVVNNKNTAEELKARQRKMITSKSVNDISVVQQQQSSHLLISDENFNTTQSNTNNIIDFTSDPNLSNSINCNNKPVKLSRRHKDPERRKSLIQTFSSFFNKNKKDNMTMCHETSPTKEKEYKQPAEVGGSVFSRFRISPKSKDKSKEKDETPQFEQCNLTQDCLKHEFSSTPHLSNNNKNIDDTALAAAASGVLLAVTATPGIITNCESIIDNYDDDDDDEEPPPIPPLPLNYQRTDDENYTIDSREYQKKQRAISKASRQAELKRIRIAQEIQREQEEIEVQLKEYEARGVIIEKALRGEGQNIENLETSSMGASDEKLLKELLEIWRNITQLKKRDEELGIRQQELKLEYRHAQLKDELNMRLSCSKLDKSSADVAAEGAILNEMLEIVAKRAALRPNEQSSISSQAGSYVSSINQQSTSNESDQI